MIVFSNSPFLQLLNQAFDLIINDESSPYNFHATEADLFQDQDKKRLPVPPESDTFSPSSIYLMKVFTAGILSVQTLNNKVHKPDTDYAVQGMKPIQRTDCPSGCLFIYGLIHNSRGLLIFQRYRRRFQILPDCLSLKNLEIARSPSVTGLFFPSEYSDQKSISFEFR